MTQPIVVADQGWGETIPEWLRAEIASERMIDGLLGLAGKNPKEQVGDAECLVYLMTASLTAPLDGSHTRIYQYLTTRVMKRARGVDAPPDIRVTELTEDEARLLDDLRRQLYRSRGGAARNEVTDAFDQVFGKRRRRAA